MAYSVEGDLMAEWSFACRWEALIENRGRSVEIDGLWVAIFRLGDEAYALTDRCPHANAPLGRGWIEEGEIVCPLHRWRFRVEDGRCSTVSGQNLHRFPCEIRGEEVWVRV